MTEVQHYEASAGHHDSGSFGHDEVHEGLKDREYIFVALVLAVITGIEVALTYATALPHWFFMLSLLTLMTVKFFTVVLFFMHVKYDAKIFGRLFYLGLGLAVSVYLAALLMFHYFSG
jgi:cytochrome c oxidase subunit 4